LCFKSSRWNLKIVAIVASSCSQEVVRSGLIVFQAVVSNCKLIILMFYLNNLAADLTSPMTNLEIRAGFENPILSDPKSINTFCGSIASPNDGNNSVTNVTYSNQKYIIVNVNCSQASMQGRYITVQVSISLTFYVKLERRY